MLQTAEGIIPENRTAFGDNVTAIALAFGIMMALFVREKTGVGQAVDLNLLQMGMYQISFDVAGALVTRREYGEWKRRSRYEHPNALGGLYTTKDGRQLLLTVLQPDRYWSRFCQAVGREDLEHDPRFESFVPRRENHVILTKILEEMFLTKTFQEWNSILSGVIPYGPVNNLLEVINDPQAKANDFFVPIDHPTYGRIEVMANPVNLSKTPATIRMPAPELGQHTEEVLLEYGYTWEDIAQLKEQGVI